MIDRVELIFDGDCGLCRASVDWLKRRDRNHSIQFFPSRECSWNDADLMPFSETVVVRDAQGSTYVRSSAVARALSVLPRFWGIFGKWVLLINRIAFFRIFNDFQYNLVSRNRHTVAIVLSRFGFLRSKES